MTVTPELLAELEAMQKSADTDHAASVIFGEMLRDHAPALIRTIRGLNAKCDLLQESLQEVNSVARQHRKERDHARKERDEAREDYRRQKAEAFDLFAAWHEERKGRDAYKAKATLMRDLLEDLNDDCAYGDGCPSNAGTRHGTCLPCRVRELLEKVGP